MPKLEFIRIHTDSPIFGRGFNPKGLPNLKEISIRTDENDQIFETECNVEFENLQRTFFAHVNPHQIIKFCQQNSGLKRIQIYRVSYLEENPIYAELLPSLLHVMTCMSQIMPKLEFIRIHTDGPIFGQIFNPKGLPNLKEIEICMDRNGQIFKTESECNVDFENLQRTFFAHVNPHEIVKFCQQNSGLKTIDICDSDLEEIPNLMESLFSHVPNLEIFKYDRDLSPEIIGQLTQHCPKLNTLVLERQQEI